MTMMMMMMMMIRIMMRIIIMMRITNYDENNESSYFKYCYVNNLYGWAMSQKPSVNNFEWIENTDQFNENFEKAIIKKVLKDIFSKLIFHIPKITRTS